MVARPPPAGISPFMISHLPDFFARYGLSYTIDGPQLEYFVYDKKSGLDISCSLTFDFNAPLAVIKVMTFYPNISPCVDSRFLSAVCFFMVMQHLAGFYHIDGDCRILLRTRRDVFDTFYALLKDFNFRDLLCDEEDLICIGSRFHALSIDTSMIDQRALIEELL